jgi:hypothetical protein
LLHRPQVVGFNALASQRSKAGVYAVHGLTTGNRRQERGPRPLQALAADRGQGDGRRVAGYTFNLL